MIGWRECRLGDLCEITRGASPRPIHEWISDIGTPWVKISDATSTNSRFIESTKEFIKSEGENYSVVVDEGDLILSNSATPGLPRFLKIRACIHDGWLLFRNVKNLDKLYLYYLLIADREKYVQLGNGSIFTNLKTEILKEHTFLLPPLPEQKVIAEVLSSLDDKIDLLTRQNKTLEDLGQAYFRKWFDDEKNVGRLGDYIQLFDNKRIPLSAMEREKKKDGKLYPYYGAATIMDYINDYIFDGEYILLGEDGTVETADGYPVLQYATGKFWCNNHAHILQAKPPYTNYSLWFCLRQCTISHIVSGAVQPKINQQNLNSLEIPVPPQNVFDKINEISGNIFSKILANSEQIYTLQKLRDTLLPKLISGEVRVKI